MTVRQFLIISFIVASPKAVAQTPSGDTVKLYFEIGDPTLTKKTASKLDSLLYQDVINAQSRLTIIGYADHLGSEEKNRALSENRSRNVLDYLEQMGVKKENVTLCIGKGEVTRAVKKENGYPTDRRVDIVINTKIKIARKATPTPPVSKIQVSTPPPPDVPAPVKAPTNIPPPVTRDSTVAPTLTNVDINTLKPGETLVLDKIYFYSGRHFVREESIPELEKLYNTLDDNPNLKIQIEGHVCCVNSVDALDEDTFELALSKNRARSIYEYLVKKGIEPERLRYKGFGKTRPAVKVERSAADEDRNRRVEIRVLK